MTEFVTGKYRAGVAGHGPTCATSRVWSILWMALMDVPGLSRCGTMAAVADQHRDMQVKETRETCMRTDVAVGHVEPNPSSRRTKYISPAHAQA